MHCKICDKSFTGPVSFQQHEASEKHKKKVALYQITTVGAASQGTSTDNNDSLIIPCTVCGIQLTGMVNFQVHVNSLQHAYMIRNKSDGDIAPNDLSGTTPNEPEINQMNPSSNIPFYFSDAALSSYAECEVCQKKFSGEAPYQQHLVSETHKKKCILKGISIVPENKLKSVSEEGAIAGDENNPGNNFPVYSPNPLLGSYADCKVCQKQFSGPAPYQQHLVSEAHKKKCIQKGVSIVPENQLKDASNELVNAEAKDEINPSPNISFNIPNEALGSFAECKVCQKQFSGPAPYQQHLVSAQHKKKVIHKELSSLSLDTVDSDKIMPVTSHMEKIFARCEPCGMRFSGSEPYQLHLESEAHQKRIAVVQSPSFQVLENINGVASSLKCDTCAKDFSGPVPYSDHLNSEKHKKKVQSLGFLKKINSSLSPEPDSSTPTPNVITQDVKVNTESSVINREWFCEVCKVQMSGPDPYRQHIYGAMHRKNSNLSLDNILSKNDESKSDVFNYNNGDKSKDFHIRNDLILCDALKSMGVVGPDDLNITIFYPDDEIVFDNTMKKNNYNKNIISELNSE